MGKIFLDMITFISFAGHHVVCGLFLCRNINGVVVGS